MTELNQIYKCSVCGNILEILHTGVGELVCCSISMSLMKESSVDAALEKHKPIITKDDDVIFVKVGSIEHPMDENHYIEWIELIVDDKVYRQNLKPGDNPEARFEIIGENMFARAYCNLHGLWKSD